MKKINTTHQLPLKSKSQIIKAFPNGIDKLEIGSGEHPEAGYIHLDIQENLPDLDILSDVKKSPIPDNFVSQEIRAVHIMEHFCHPEFSSVSMQQEWGTTKEVLQEMFRILKPGGKLRIVTPDFDKISRSASLGLVSRDWLQRWTVGGHLNNYDVHHWLWTHKDAEKWMGEVGFININDWNPVQGPWKVSQLKWWTPQVSGNKNWHDIEWYHWLFIEAQKP